MEKHVVGTEVSIVSDIGTIEVEKLPPPQD